MSIPKVLHFFFLRYEIGYHVVSFSAHHVIDSVHFGNG